MKDYNSKESNNQEENGKYDSLLNAGNINGLEELARIGAQKILEIALKNEIDEYIEKYRDKTDENGRRIVYRNGYHREREIQTGIGALRIKQPRVDDRKAEEKFSSDILPKYIRRAPGIDNLIPILYLNGVSTGEFSYALESILGKGRGVSANTVMRLKGKWEKEYDEWRMRDLSGKRYCYIWADGIYMKHRDNEDKKSCILVIIGVNEYGEKEFLSIESGIRESTISWKEVLLDLKGRGVESPKLAIGDGGMGFWAALREVYPQTKEQRCWVHKTVNIMDKLPKKYYSKAKKMIHDIYFAPDKEDAEKNMDKFISVFDDKYPKATKCLSDDKEELLTFYEFPAKHFQHIRTTNPIESTFSTIRLRTKSMRNCGTRKTTLTMMFKLSQSAQDGWRKLRGYDEIPLVLEGKIFKDGEFLKDNVA